MKNQNLIVPALLALFTALACSARAQDGQVAKPEAIIIDVEVAEVGGEDGEGTVKAGRAVYMDAQGNIIEKRFGGEEATFELLEASGIEPGGKISPRDLKKNAQRLRKFMEAHHLKRSKATQQRLGFNDEEWPIIEALIEKVRQRQDELRLYDSRGKDWSSARTAAFKIKTAQGAEKAADKGAEKVADGDAHPASRQSEEPEALRLRAALRQALADEDADAVKSAIGSLRDSRRRAADALERARKELRALVTAQQEGELILLGVLD